MTENKDLDLDLELLLELWDLERIRDRHIKRVLKYLRMPKLISLPALNCLINVIKQHYMSIYFSL